MEKTIKVLKVLNLLVGIAYLATSIRQTREELRDKADLRAAQAAHEESIRREFEKGII